MKISEVAEKVDLTPVTLRYYEKMGLIPEVKRSTVSETIVKMILTGSVLSNVCGMWAFQ